jgi:DNA invertase Pin-like site-specific DNA recombinase
MWVRVGYARVSTVGQDTAVQEQLLVGLGAERVFVDHGLTGKNRERPGLREAFAACRVGDTLVVTKLDRLARSVPDARDLADELSGKGVILQIGSSRYDPTDPVGRLLVNVLAMVAEFEGDLISARIREGMAAARANGKPRGRPPLLPAGREAKLVRMHQTGEHTVKELAEIFGIGRATVYRAIDRHHSRAQTVSAGEGADASG